MRSARCGGTGSRQTSIEITRFSSFVLFGGPASRPRFGRAPAADHRGEGAVDMDWRCRVGFVRAVWLRSGGLASFGRFWLRSGGLASCGRFWLRSGDLASFVLTFAVMPGRDGARRTRPCLNRHFSSDRRGRQEHLVNIYPGRPRNPLSSFRLTSRPAQYRGANAGRGLTARPAQFYCAGGEPWPSPIPSASAALVRNFTLG